MCRGRAACPRSPRHSLTVAQHEARSPDSAGLHQALHQPIAQHQKELQAACLPSWPLSWVFLNMMKMHVCHIQTKCHFLEVLTCTVFQSTGHPQSAFKKHYLFIFAVEIDFPAAVFFGKADSARDRNDYYPHLLCHVLLTLICVCS